MLTTKEQSKLEKEKEAFLQIAKTDIRNYEKYLSSNASILNIIYESLAYMLPIRETALQKYLKNNWEVNKLSRLADSELGYGEHSPKITSYKSSVDNRSWNRNMKNLLRSTIALDKVPSQHNDESMRAVRQQIDEDYLPKFKNYRKEQALAIKQKYRFGSNLFEKAYESIIKLVSGKEQVSNEELKVIEALEIQGIDKALIELYIDLGYSRKITSLYFLRKKTPKGIKNTACYNCGKTLMRSNNEHYCTKRENRKCFEKIKRIKKLEEAEIKFVTSLKRCASCDKQSVFSHVHKISEQEFQFCSTRCYNTYRKRIQRKNKAK